VLKRIFGPKRNEVTGEWRKLHNEEPNCLVGEHQHFEGSVTFYLKWRQNIPSKRW
jgi:hypothetical protein